MTIMEGNIWVTMILKSNQINQSNRLDWKLIFIQTQLNGLNEPLSELFETSKKQKIGWTYL